MQYRCFDGLVHGSYGFSAVIPRAREISAAVAEFLGEALSPRPRGEAPAVPGIAVGVPAVLAANSTDMAEQGKRVQSVGVEPVRLAVGGERGSGGQERLAGLG